MRTSDSFRSSRPKLNHNRIILLTIGSREWKAATNPSAVHRCLALAWCWAFLGLLLFLSYAILLFWQRALLADGRYSRGFRHLSESIQSLDTSVRVWAFYFLITYGVCKKKKMQILWGLALYFLITCIGTE